MTNDEQKMLAPAFKNGTIKEEDEIYVQDFDLEVSLMFAISGFDIKYGFFDDTARKCIAVVKQIGDDEETYTGKFEVIKGNDNEILLISPSFPEDKWVYHSKEAQA